MSTRLRVQASPAYKRLWPQTCDGKNLKGEQMQLDADLFACHMDGNEVQRMVDAGWSSPNAACCQGVCMTDTDAVGQCHKDPFRPLTIAEAARRAALAVKELETQSGHKVGVVTHTASTEEHDATGVLATVEIRMFGDTLRFQCASADLTPAATDFLSELKDPMALLMTMHLTAFPESDAGIVVCPHGSTTATKDTIREDMKDLPKQRAESLGEAIRDALPAAVASLGKASGHYAEEDAEKTFPGGRFGAILYKIYDASSAPECTLEDLYRFPQHVQDFGSDCR